MNPPFYEKNLEKTHLYLPKVTKTRSEGHINTNKYLLNGCLAELDGTLKNN